MEKELDKILSDLTFIDTVQGIRRKDKAISKIISLFKKQIEECEEELPDKLNQWFWLDKLDMKDIAKQILKIIKCKVGDGKCK